MSTGNYTNVEIYGNGAKLTEATSVKISRTSKAQIVETLARGFAGVSPGAKMLTISVENATPSASLELDPGLYIKTLKVFELTLYCSGKTLTSKGFITDDSMSFGVNSVSSLSFEFQGEYADWE